MLRFSFDKAAKFMGPHVAAQESVPGQNGPGGLAGRARAAHEALLAGTGTGSEWLGWRRILQDPNDALLEEIASLAKEIRREADVLICIGIGGSYLGAKAVIEALSPYFRQPTLGNEGAETDNSPLDVIFAGHHVSDSYLTQLFDSLEGKSVYVNVISKSGTTLEPAIAFRFARQWMESHFSDSSDRIIATTDPERGALRALALELGYRTFDIPSDIGGRFSLLSPAGLIPIAAAGFDIRSLFYGSVAMMNELSSPVDNPALDYAMTRYGLHESGYTTELLSVFEPRLAGLSAWWQQLFGESEGKDKRGLFPATCTYTTDLHSIGQYVQEGKRNLIETFLIVDDDRRSAEIPFDSKDPDGLNYVAGKTLTEVNKAAYSGTMEAHLAGGVPVQSITMDSISEENIGRLVYFFEHAVSLGGYLLGINPFDQPGVEAYKSEMFRLLGR